jgi:thiamine-phosphate pyrophosphorylase
MLAALPYPCLCLVTDRGVCPADEIPDRVLAAVAGGVDMVQLRDKDLPGSVVLELARQLREVCGERALLIVNERADVAVVSGADGVQLGEAAMPTDSVRAIVGERAWIGRSVHSASGAVEANATTADFLLVGTMFASRSHPGEEPSGPELLARIRVAGVDKPLLGIGGITDANVAEVLAAGAHGAAVITSVLASDDPEEAAGRLKTAMLESVARRQEMSGQTDAATRGSRQQEVTGRG